ncbi:MAG: NADP-dependent glyceraldehyde-3-phosphate dehydrogenase, partial [Ignisphaera sp.]
MVFELRGDLFREIAEEVDGIHVFKTFLAGEWVSGSSFMDVRSPIDLSVIGRVPKLSWSDVDRALDKVYRVGRWSVRDLPGWR